MSGETAARDKNIIARLQGLTAALCTPLDEQFNLDVKHQLNNPDCFAIISGDEYLYGAALFEGIRHFTMGGPGNICPSFCTLIQRDAVNGDWESVRKRQRRLVDFCNAVYPCAETTYAVVKYVMQHLGICSARMVSPHRTVSTEQAHRLDAALGQFADVLEA